MLPYVKTHLMSQLLPNLPLATPSLSTLKYRKSSAGKRDINRIPSNCLNDSYEDTAAESPQIQYLYIVAPQKIPSSPLSPLGSIHDLIYYQIKADPLL